MLLCRSRIWAGILINERMKKFVISVMVADDNREFCNLLSDYISSHEDINLVATANNGIDAVDKVIELLA
mgnify:CR=1 FL=1